MKNSLPKTYEVGISGRGFPTIIIRRKPSEVPYSLSQALLRLACVCHTDAPNSREEYEFVIPERLPRAVEVLQGAEWVEVPRTNE